MRYKIRGSAERFWGCGEAGQSRRLEKVWISPYRESDYELTRDI